MANEQYITIRGRLTGPPELRFTPSGKAVANFSVASNARKFDKQQNEWKDAPPTFWRCAAWGELGENVAESLDKGMAVIVLAEISSRSYDKDGQTRTVLEANVEAIGPDLRFQSAKVARTQRSGGNEGGFSNTHQPGGQQPPGNDPWGQGGDQPNNAPQGGGWNGPDNDEPPF